MGLMVIMENLKYKHMIPVTHVHMYTYVTSIIAASVYFYDTYTQIYVYIYSRSHISYILYINLSQPG